MSERTVALAEWRTSLRTQLAMMAPRERQALALAGLVLGLFLVWTLAVRPALATLRQAAVEAERLELQWQSMQRLAQEAQQLRGIVPVAAPQAAAALAAATERLGPAGRLSLQGERAVLVVDGLSTSQLRDWLAEARSGARARPVEANLVRGPQGYSGTLVVSLESAR